jgi:RNA polymerase sigma-70 factor, ECF subfamily
VTVISHEAQFEQLVREHSGRMLAVARRYLANEEDAREAVQQAFLSAYRGLGGFSGSSELSTWMHRITVNACLSVLRARRRRPETSIDALLPRFTEDGHRAGDARDWSGALAMERGEARAQVRGAIARLPESYRLVLMMRDIDGLSTQQSAEMLGVSQDVVKTRLHRARQALRELLVPYFGGAT